MKTASAAALAVLAAGSIKRIDLYKFTLAGGAQSYYFTSHQVPVIVGGQLYNTGLVLSRGAIKQTNDLSVESMQLTCAPQSDNSTGSPLIAGVPFLQAAALRMFDSARVLFSKMFLNDFNDLSPGAVAFYEGRVNDTQVDELAAVFTINHDYEMLNVSAPAKIIQVACGHTWADSGCGLNAANFTVTGTVTAGGTVTTVPTGLTQVDDYFTLGKITFTSGANATNPRTTYYVKQYTGGTFSLIRPLPHLPAAGDTFAATPGCNKKMSGCANANASVGPPFNNLKRFNGKPFVPNPETLYDGGTSNTSIPTAGAQGGASVGSAFGASGGLRGLVKP